MEKKYLMNGIDKLNKTEFSDLCENLQNGIANINTSI